MRYALERQRAGKVHVIPVILRPCEWQHAPLESLQVLPRSGQLLTTWQNQDEALLEVSRSLHALLKQPLPTRSTTHEDMENRTNMFIKLQRFYDEALDDSVQKAAWIDLSLNHVLGVVHTTANMVLRRTGLPAQPIPPGISIHQIYQQANHELLILGAPGAGKSTLLYHLGRDLLMEAQSAHRPLPVVFPLASWSQRHRSLQEWMIEQLASPLYDRIPHRQSQQWFEHQQILPLLDGLDEVEEAARPACITAINTFRRSFPLCLLVVCSRTQEYWDASQQERLQLYSAVEVQPLTVAQQEAVLQQAGRVAERLRVELARNEVLRELASSPLWLTLLLATVQHVPQPTFPLEPSNVEQEVLGRYVARMCERKGDADRYPLEQTLHWLGFLAGQLRQRNQVVFALEELQPDWLSQRTRRGYDWSVGLLGGLLGGLGTGLLGGLLGGLVFVLKSNITLAERLIWSWKKVGSGPLWKLLWVLLGGLSSGLGAGLRSGLLWGLGTGLVVGLFFVLFFVLVGGLEGKQAITRDTSYAGKGLSHSARNGLLVVLFFGPLVGLFFGLFVVLFFGPLVGLFFGLNVGLGAGLFGLEAGLFFGLGAALQHLTLRFWLARMDGLPWKAIAFLDDACERALLKRVGGTYRFFHQVGLEYFADLEQQQTHLSSGRLATAQAVEPRANEQTT